MTQARRRIDEVLDPSFSDGLEELDLETLRRRRSLADEVENELSYYRRLLQGRLDLLRFEVRRRSGEETRSLIEALPEILSDRATGARRHSSHLTTDLPPLPDVGKRDIDKLLGADVIVRLNESSDEQVSEAIEAIEEMESEISGRRREVQQVADSLAEALATRYRDNAGH